MHHQAQPSRHAIHLLAHRAGVAVDIDLCHARAVSPAPPGTQARGFRPAAAFPIVGASCQTARPAGSHGQVDWDIPANLQPDPDDYEFDLERTLRSVVGLRANVPADAFTAGTLGTERTGSGAVIGADGLVLTIGYLITEADSVWLITADGRAVPGHPLAFDQTTGFGLVQALGRLDLPALDLGDSNSVALGTPAILAAAGGREHAVETKVIGKQEFAGYWEYLLRKRSSPPPPTRSGAAPR